VAADLIQAVRRPPRIVSGCGDDPVDFGEVGDIAAIGTGLLDHLCDGGYLPVVNSLGSDPDGQVLNINADIAANRIAIAMGASKLFLLTGAPGVLRDAEDPTSVIDALSIAEAKTAIVDGIIGGGMIPKLEESFVALEAGVGAIHILGAATPNGLLRELSEDQRTGTLLYP
jgi:acetylglutamate kinase